MITGFIKLYQLGISPFLHAMGRFFFSAEMGCRYHPHCSEYGRQAFQDWGWRRGAILTVKRILRCHPWSQWGFDPVPKRTLSIKLLLLAMIIANSIGLQSAQAQVLENEFFKVSLSQGAALIEDMELKTHNRSVDPEEELFWGRPAPQEKNSKEFVDLSYVTNLNNSQVSLAFNLQDYSYLSTIQGKWTASGAKQAAWSYEDDKVKLQRIVTLAEDGPYLNAVWEISFKEDQPVPALAYVLFDAANASKDREVIDRYIYYYQEDRAHYQYIYESSLFGAGEGLPLSGVDLENLPTQWISVVNRYFAMALVADSDRLPEAGIYGKTQAEGEAKATAIASLVYKVDAQQRGLRIPLKVYFGPKDLELLSKAHPTLKKTVDYGVFSFIALPFLWVLQKFYTFMHNYGLAIILLTLLVKIALFPLVLKSTKSMKAMQEIQPKINRLKEKHGDDRQNLNLAMMQLFKDNGVNPLSGCMPMLLQIPVFFALYKVLYVSVELYQAPFFGWLQDMSASDPYYIMPILVCLTWWAQQLVTPVTTTDPMQKRMLQIMPLVFGLMMITMPQGLGVYFLVNALVSIAQQMMLNKKFGIKPSALPSTS